MLGKNSTVMMVMLIIGFGGFLGSVFTGSLALAAVASGFFGGATCIIGYSLLDRQEAVSTVIASQPKSDAPAAPKQPYGMRYAPQPKKEVKQAPVREIKRDGLFSSSDIEQISYERPKEDSNAVDEIQPSDEEIPYI